MNSKKAELADCLRRAIVTGSRTQMWVPPHRQTGVSRQKRGLLEGRPESEHLCPVPDSSTEHSALLRGSNDNDIGNDRIAPVDCPRPSIPSSISSLLSKG